MMNINTQFEKSLTSAVVSKLFLGNLLISIFFFKGPVLLIQ